MSDRFAPEVVDKLLDRLGNDDAFRTLFQSDPRAALKQVGHETPAADIGVAGKDPVMCCQNATLGSKESIRATRDQLQEKLRVLNPFSFFTDAAP